MTYEARETGVQTAEPVELYEFAHGANVYRYTSSVVDVEFGGETYAAVTMNRNSIDATSEIARSALTLTCARTLPLLEIFNPVPPSDVITLLVRRFHRGDAEAIIIWMGRILGTGLSGLQATIRCESVFSSLKRPGLRRMYQRQCDRVLYACGVDREDFRHASTLVSAAGLSLTLSSMGAFADAYFAGGYIEWTRPSGFVERRAIREQTGAVVLINYQASGLVPGQAVDIFPGCDHTIATCDAKFGNSLAYGGFLYIPRKNPFDGTPVF